jgi:hypothetical protein
LPTARPVGLDMPFLFHMYIGQAAAGPDEARHEMDLAVARGFTHARVIVLPYWPNDMKGPTGWAAHPDAYFAAFDALVTDARARGLHLVPSLLWETFLFPDLAGEPRGQLFVRDSPSRKLAERFITQFVTRYKDDDTILFWELGNELNLQADLDVTCDACSGSPACLGLASICVGCGTPCKRTSADNLYSCNDCRSVSSAQEDLGAFSADLAALIHGLDPTRSVSSGNTLPRYSAYHQSRAPGADWTGDTPEQFDSALLNLHPAGVDLISIHPYPEGADVSPARFGDSDLAGVALLARIHALALKNGKKLYVGEYGQVNGGGGTCGSAPFTCGGDATKWFSRRMADALVREGVEYSGMWAFEAYEDIRCPTVPNCYTVTDSDPFMDHLALRQKAFGTCAAAADSSTCPGGTCMSQVCLPALTPPASAPQSIGHATFASADDVKAWATFTNCTGCAQGTFAVDGAQKVARLVSHDLPCTGTCAYPGAYAFPPAVPVQPGHLTLRFSARTTSEKGRVAITPRDSGKQPLTEYDVAVTTLAQPGTNGVTFQLPDGTADVQVTLQLLAPNATLEVGSIDLEWQP